MKHSLYQQAMAAAAGLLLSLLWFVACSDEGGNNLPEVPEVQYAKVTISLGTADNATPAFTKAGETVEEGADESYEHFIQNWWVVIVNEAGNVAKVLTNDPLGGISNEDPDSENSIETQLPIGSWFTFYAFANLNSVKKDTNSGAAYIQTLQPGATFEVNKAVELLEMADYTESNKNYIPMSSYASDKLQVQEDATKNKVELLLIRLLGKVSVTVTNASTNAITLKQITLDKFRTGGAIYLLPYDAAESKSTQNLLATDMKDNYRPSFPQDATSSYTQKTITPENTTISATADDKAISYTATFFAPETDFQTANGGDLQITLDVEGRNNKSIATDFSFIRRNDWLKIPILVSEAEVKITLKQPHMPIGGIPKELTFGPGAILAEQTYWTRHAGDLTFEYELTKLNNATNWELKYYATTYEPKERFCCVQLIENGSEGHPGLILKPAEGEANYVKLPWLSTDAWGFQMTPVEESSTKGSFTIRLQELVPDAETSTARIKLTLVATKGTSTVILPYYINIKFGSQPTTGEGA
ncbi:MAG: hypothetical protein MR544_05100 [Parabacteroides sp.]|nr:hypothetical protein [Parabacteroides sp.]